MEFQLEILAVFCFALVAAIQSFRLFDYTADIVGLRNACDRLESRLEDIRDERDLALKQLEKIKAHLASVLDLSEDD